MSAPLRSGSSRKPKSPASAKATKPAAEKSVPGVVIGLALTRTGATAATVECLPLPGRGKLILTGNLIGSARDAAQVAVSLVRARAKSLKLDPALFLGTDFHFHVMDPLPQKGGPSIGLPMFVALVSALTKKPVDRRFAFTGELSLTGAVLPVEGIKAKIAAAKRAGCTRVYVPKENMQELKIQSTSHAAEIVSVASVSDALKTL
jgi:ATP-dependent Lon protease